jgi:hypothetical protein
MCIDVKDCLRFFINAPHKNPYNIKRKLVISYPEPKKKKIVYVVLPYLSKSQYRFILPDTARHSNANFFSVSYFLRLAANYHD